MDIWKNVKGFNFYMVSNTGKVKSLRFSREKMLIPYIGTHGYYVVTLWDKKQNCKLIHHLVAIAFLGHTPNKHTLVVNHKDGNKLNNNLNNLEIVTHHDNITTLKCTKHSSKYRGVTWHKQASRWQAYIQSSYKNKYLGLFETEEQASEAYENALKNILTGL
jgi:hypothetical protein